MCHSSIVCVALLPNVLLTQFGECVDVRIHCNQTHQIYLEELPVCKSFGACIMGLASRQIFDDVMVMLVLNCGIGGLINEIDMTTSFMMEKQTWR